MTVKVFGKGMVKQYSSLCSLHAIWDHTRVTFYLAEAVSPALTPAITNRYSINPPIKDGRLSRPEPMQVNDLPGVATEMSAIPGVSLFSRLFAVLRTVGVNNLPKVVMY